MTEIFVFMTEIFVFMTHSCKFCGMHIVFTVIQILTGRSCTFPTDIARYFNGVAELCWNSDVYPLTVPQACHQRNQEHLVL